MNQLDCIEHEIVYPHAIEQVWEALTDSDQLAGWLMANDFVPANGQRFTFFDHEPWPDGNIYDVVCEIVVCEPPCRLSYSWASHPRLGETLVEWTLTSIPGGTRVRLRHSGFASHGQQGRDAFDLLRNGWGGLLEDELRSYLEARTTREVERSE